MVDMKAFPDEEIDQQQTYQNKDGGPSYGQQPPPGAVGSNRPEPKTITVTALNLSLNQDLLVSKSFYFFFFSAFGSLFPLMAVYFKQLGMNPTQCGVLIGFRPLVEFVSAPFWGSMADRFKKGKPMLLFSLCCWIVFTLALAFVQPPASSCVVFNDTHHVLYNPGAEYGRVKRNLDEVETYPLIKASTFLDTVQSPHWMTRIWKRSTDQHKHHKQPLPPDYVVGKSPHSVEYTLNYNRGEHISYVSPPFSSIVYKWDDVQTSFFLLLLLVILGEIFAAPAITLADSATLSYLGDDMDNYGKQRMFGSLGWGLAMFFVGIALDHSTAFADHPCGAVEGEKNYTICFATFSVLMGCALISATQFRFDYENLDDNNIPMKPVEANGNQSGYSTVILNQPTADEKPTAKSTVFAQTTKQLPECFTVLKGFANLRYGAFLYVTWFMGFGVGLVFTFLFWHLQDLGGTPTLFGVASVINHISEIFAYFFSFKIIKQIGHTKVLCVGLAGNVCRFLYVSWLSNPWWVLPFEFIQGITHAAVWAACCSYIAQATPSTLRSSAQGVLQGLHHGLGRGCGAVIGGMFVNSFGTQATFRGYGFACLVVLIAFILINYYRRDKGFSNFQDEQEPDTVVEEGVHLAPHGVPSNPIMRSLSKQNISDMQPSPSNPTNPFNPQKPAGNYLDLPNMGGGGGGGGGGGMSYADVNMNTMNLPPRKAFLMTRSALAAAFNPKGLMASATSPEAKTNFDFIRREFQVYQEVTSDMIEDASDVKSNSSVIPKTALHTPQPVTNNTESNYEW